jgi:hypothetical protein
MSVTNRLSFQEKSALFFDGFVVLRGVVDKDSVRRARTLINQDVKKIFHFDHPDINDLYNRSPISKILNDVMGPHTRPMNAQVAVTSPNTIDAVSRTNFDVNSVPPPKAHVDGGWAGLCPLSQTEIVASGSTLHNWGHDGDPRSMGPNGAAPLWQDPQRRLAIGSYTALVGVCLSDQLDPGKGQFAVRKGAHESVQSFFRYQRDQGGPIGGGGPEWPRLIAGTKGRAFAGSMPEAMEQSYPINEDKFSGWLWPELTPVLMEEGDVVIALHSLPHTATPNLSGDPRVNVYFRIRRLREDNPYEGDERVGWGLSDHPDRALNGDFLDYPGHYDPFEYSIEKLCDHWSEWQGMSQFLNQRSV